jgi:hypothetical protein
MSFAGRLVRHHHERPDGTGYPDQLKGAGDSTARANSQRRQRLRDALTLTDS